MLLLKSLISDLKQDVKGQSNSVKVTSIAVVGFIVMSAILLPGGFLLLGLYFLRRQKKKSPTLVNLNATPKIVTIDKSGNC